MSLFQVTDFAELAAQNGAVQAVQAMLTTVTGVTEAGASLVTPPGGEGASAKITATQQAATQQFAAMVTQGLMELEKHIGTTSIFGATSEGVQAIEAANLTAVAAGI